MPEENCWQVVAVGVIWPVTSTLRVLVNVQTTTSFLPTETELLAPGVNAVPLRVQASAVV